MRYHILTTDYDGTIAENEHVSEATLAALVRLKATGRYLILVTGRELDQLQAILPEYTIFDLIVAENGALIYHPATLKKILLGERPPQSFIQALKDKGIPLSIGEVIVATWEPHQDLVLETIKAAGLEYQVIFNKGAIMILPPGVNKATGLHRALRELNLSEHNTVAVGDAENDNAMLQAAECAVAVNNALPQLKANADWVTDSQRGEGVSELIRGIIQDDLASLDSKLLRHYLGIGQNANGSPFAISPYGNNILLSGTSGCGKTTLAAAFIGKLIDRKYQFCLIDPEGDYQDLAGAITVGDSSQPPLIDHVVKVLSQTDENAIVCFLSIPLSDRPAYFKKLRIALTELRKNTGHPHFIIIDEAHHVLPKENTISFNDFPEDFTNIFAITTQPDLLCHDLLKRVDMVLAMGDLPGQTLAVFAGVTGVDITLPNLTEFKKRDALVWQKGTNSISVIKSSEPSQFLMRHKRKYASGDMYSNSFYFTGPSHHLNLKANNLMIFIQMAAGIDDETWLYHLHRHDYSKWFRNSVKDPKLSLRSEAIENNEPSAALSRKEIFSLILNRYTLPA
ncbi:HAD family hydrolase [Mucilaginibacter paludis]|uniref:HAD-superfamily hydrolase, subfamily IIB n=1 Tax=Mucilaginibacter paludis DSM 18603 TaxID=714943 RepID=H1Y628_9SPHI|nr:HAD family hydrolase [Mucilaginibacter paludis]EHQ30987.1 HAD-superfamily hydrolase, subfamily IIB [Mucilaginibacter paludis DSM 18603]